MKVMKFGGGCLATPELIQKAARLAAESPRVVVVVSALYRVTDIIDHALQSILTEPDHYFSALQELRSIHLSTAESVISDPAALRRLTKDIEQLLQELESLFFSTAHLKELSESTSARILSYGERLSAILLAGVIRHAGVGSTALTSESAGIVAEINEGVPRIDLKASSHTLSSTLLPLLSQNTIPVITGFYATTPQGKFTTFGRNASDYSAAAVACATGADTLIIWKNVAGFMTIDPGQSARAATVPSISYQEAGALSHFGAKILHPMTFSPLENSGVKVFIQSIANPRNPGTEIVSSELQKKQSLTGMACNHQIRVIRIVCKSHRFQSTLIAAVSSAMDRSQIEIIAFLTCPEEITLIVPVYQGAAAKAALHKLDRFEARIIEPDTPQSLVALVGKGLTRASGLVRVFSVLSGMGIPVNPLSSAGHASLYFLINRSDSAACIQAIHQEFFSPNKIRSNHLEPGEINDQIS